MSVSFWVWLIVYTDHLWDASTHIGMGGLLRLRVIRRSTRVRLGTAVGVALTSYGVMVAMAYGVAAILGRKQILFRF